jgi:suppressor for copper-sensitivity B
MKKLFILLFSASLLYFNSSFAATSEWKKNEASGASTRLIGSFYQDETGAKKLIAGLEFKMPQGWKIYGQGSEGIGVPPSFDFGNSKNYLKHEITWPKAEEHEEKFGNESFKYFAYHDDIILPITFDLKEAGSETELSLKLNYGICKDVCIPVEENFTLKITGDLDQKSLQQIQKFYPQKIIQASSEQAETKEAPMSSSLIYWTLIAIIGGALLNIMPCVLPVLSIKLLSVIDHLDANISRIRFAFFSTICGIVLCFLFFAICAALISYVGNSFGWGLQFQNPYFLIFLIIILILFIANLMGVFEITFDQFSVNFLNAKITDSEGKRNIFIPNFLSGILAVLLATPCSAPILGSAISFALTKQIFDIFIIFLAIGTGFALPYIVLMIAPKLIFLLPKPGKWMLKIKKLMAVLLGVTVLWLAYILSHNIGIAQSISIAVLATLLLVCLKIRLKFIKFIVIAAILGAAFAMPQTQKPAAPEIHSEDQIPMSIWINFDENLIYQFVMEGKVVVIDVTADWCITCKVNKARVLDDAEVMVKLNSGNVVTMRADITKPNPEVMNFLRKHNRFAIPFNAVYGPNAKTGLLTSEFLTKKELLELIEKAQ